MARKFTAEEKAAAREALKDAEGEEAVRAAFEKMTPEDRALGERIHAIVKQAAPDLKPKTWYGMPAYADGEGRVICFFKNSGKFKARYSEFGFNGPANLDDGAMWPIVYAITELKKADEARLAKLVKQAVSA